MIETSEFAVSPLRSAARTADAGRTWTPRPRVEPKRWVLVVDDDPGICRLLERVVRDLVPSVESVLVNSAEAALEAVAKETPTLIISDVSMPGLSGVDLCSLLSADPRTRDVPVVLMTGDRDPKLVSAGISAGAADFVLKPFSSSELLLRIHSQLELAESRNQERRSLMYLEMINRTAHDAIVVLDEYGRVVSWNGAASRMFGYTADEVIGQELHHFIVPEHLREAHCSAFASFQATGQSTHFGQTLEFCAVRKGGAEFPIELSLSASRIDGAWWSVGIVRDASARVQAAQARERERARLESMLDALPVGVAMVGGDDRVQWVNQAARELIGTSDFANRRAHDLFCDCSDESCSAFKGGDLLERAERDLCGDPSRPVLVSARPVETADQRVSLVALIDLRARRLLEIERGHARKLAAVGQLASGIAHEINTPTQYVGDSLHFLKDACAEITRLLHGYRAGLASERPREEIQAELQALEVEVDAEFLEQSVPSAFTRCFDGVSRVATIVRGMKEFAHPDSREKVAADLNRAVESTMVIARNEYKYVADVVTKFGELPPVVCHVGDLNQVFLNLIVNSAHAIGDVVGQSGNRGTITISTRSDGAWVQIDIADTGAGIPDHVRARMFEPFFTTKAVGKGTGQGLAIARSVVCEKHHGTLTFESQPGVGTTFTIRLPVEGKPLPSTP